MDIFVHILSSNFFNLKKGAKNMANDFNISLLAGLDISKSKEQIDKDINAIKSNIGKLEIETKISPDTAKNITSQLNNLQIGLKDITIDKATLDGLVNQINSALGNINIGNINVNVNSQGINKQAQNVGRNLGNIISREAEKAINNVSSNGLEKYFRIDNNASDRFREQMNQLVDGWTESKGKLVDISVQTQTIYDKNIKANIEKLKQAIVTYKNESDEIIKKVISWRQIGTTTNSKGEEQALYGFVESAKQYSKSIDTVNKKTDSFVEKVKMAESGYQNTLAKIQSSINDTNVSKPIKDDTHIQNLNSQIENVNTAITNLGNSSKSTFTDMKVEVEKQITLLQNMVKEYRNAETTATSLRAKDVGTIKADYSGKIESLISKMKSAGAYTDSFKKGIEGLQKILNEATDTSGLTKFLNGFDKLNSGFNTYKQVNNANNQSKKVGIKVSGLKSSIQDLQNISPEINKFQAEINGVKVSIQSLLGDLSKVGTQSDFSVVNEKFRAFVKSAKAAGIQVKEVESNVESMARKISSIKFKLDTESYDSKVEQLVARTNQWVDSNGQARISTTNLSTALSNLQVAYETLNKDGGNTEANQKALIEAEKQLNAEIKTVTSSITSMNASLAKTSQVDSLKQKIQSFYDKNTATHGKWGTELKRMLSDLNNEAGVTKEKFGAIGLELNGIENAARRAGKLGLSFFDTIKQGMQSFSYWTSATAIVMQGITAVRQGVSTVVSLDTALVDLKKTTSMTSDELKQFYYDANDVAKQLGVTTEQVINQASAFSRLGYSSKEAATQLAELSSKFALISPGMSVDDASTDLVSIIKAYDIDVNDILDGVLSKINEIGNNFATDNAEIAEGLKNSSAAFASLGGSFDENVALFTAGQEIVQDASQVGNALRSITMRIKGYDEETEQYSEDVVEATGKVADLTKVASNNNMGISMFTDASQTHYKSMLEYLGEISDIWDEIDEKSQNELLNRLFGKNRAQVGAAIITNFDTARKAMDAMANSAGSADKEVAITMDSIEYKLNHLSETGTGIAQNLFNTEDMKRVLDFVNLLADGLDKITGFLGLFPTVGAGLGAFLGIKDVGISMLVAY